MFSLGWQFYHSTLYVIDITASGTKLHLGQQTLPKHWKTGTSLYSQFKFPAISNHLVNV